ncbi:hypothetical protein [Carboxylicivirga marina]|uniref:Uncharacterized protein n=1 Tax=Carboxylicivirga marina TaxID=2800988 RepID=A0ABS1HP47_9BACT|nr:hypothetical protein [Carboxylicivirga marina]MBK3519474.1 hypothetical protein [Carboxylicivirga marina]
MKKLTFLFSFSLAELVQRADKVLAFIVRDMAQFAKFGYDTSFSDKIKVAADNLRELLPDDYYAAQQKLKTQLKKKSRQLLDDLISDLKLRAKYALGEKSYEFQTYAFYKLSKMSDKELVTFTVHIVNTAKGHLEQLATRNVDQTMLDAITAQRADLDDKIDDQQLSISARREMRVKRTQIANELYTLVGEACDVGKSIWARSNEAFFTDYVIYGSKKAIQEVEELEEMETSNV